MSAMRLMTYQRRKTGSQKINATSYDVVAEAEAILAEANLVSA